MKVVGNKPCPTCKLELPRERFHLDRPTRDGLHYECKSCTSIRAKAWYAALSPQRKQEVALGKAESLKRRKAESPKVALKVRLTALKYRLKVYGLKVEVYEKLLTAQDNRCAICAELMEYPCVDHCHLTNTVRGLLCRQCNVGIGNLKDSIDLVHKAWQYLKRFSKSNIAKE